jgi:hypothetical protein
MTDEEREKVIKEIAEWIDTQVIAEMIVDHLEDQEEEATVERCKGVWYQTLENLGGGVGLAV